MQCFLNGEFLLLHEARISPLDRGFLFGDGVYEVVPVYRRQPFYWRRHLARLAASLEKIRLSFDLATIEAPVGRLIEQLPQSEQVLYIQITRGEMAQRQLPIAVAAQPTVFMTSSPHPPQEGGNIKNGVDCRTVEDIRWSRCDIKSVSLLGAVLLAPPAGAVEEDVIIFRAGTLSEGSRCNFIIVKDGVLRTPVADYRMLGGITYQVVREVAQECGLPAREGDIPAADVFTADEIWLTSSVRGMLPVVRVNGHAVGRGVPGAVFEQVYRAWRAHINSGIWFDE